MRVVSRRSAGLVGLVNGIVMAFVVMSLAAPSRSATPVDEKLQHYCEHWGAAGLHREDEGRLAKDPLAKLTVPLKNGSSFSFPLLFIYKGYELEQSARQWKEIWDGFAKACPGWPKPRWLVNLEARRQQHRDEDRADRTSHESGSAANNETSRTAGKRTQLRPTTENSGGQAPRWEPPPAAVAKSSAADSHARDTKAGAVPTTGAPPDPADRTFEKLVYGSAKPLSRRCTFRSLFFAACESMYESRNEFALQRCRASRRAFRKSALGAVQVFVSNPVQLGQYNFKRRVFSLRFDGVLGDAYYSGAIRVYGGDDSVHWSAHGDFDDTDDDPRCPSIAGRGSSIAPNLHGRSVTDGIPTKRSEPRKSLLARSKVLEVPVPDLEEAERLRTRGVIVLETIVRVKTHWRRWAWWGTSLKLGGPGPTSRLAKRPPKTKSRRWKMIPDTVQVYEGLSAKVLGLRVIDLTTGRVLYSDPPSSVTKLPASDDYGTVATSYGVPVLSPMDY